VNRKEYQHRFDHVGIGGMNCNCCGPAPGKERKKALRTAKRRMKDVVKNEIQEAIEDDEAVKEAVETGQGLIVDRPGEIPDEDDDYQEYLDFMSQVIDGTPIDTDD